MKHTYIQPGIHVKDVELEDMIALSVLTDGAGNDLEADPRKPSLVRGEWDVFGSEEE